MPPGAGYVFGSYRKLPERISRSSSSTASRAWSLLALRSASRPKDRCTEKRTDRMMVMAIPRIIIVTASSARVIPRSSRSRSRKRSSTAGRLLVGGLGEKGSEVHARGQVGKLCAGADHVVDLPADRRGGLRLGVAPRVGTDRGAREQRVGRDRCASRQGGRDVDAHPGVEEVVHVKRRNDQVAVGVHGARAGPVRGAARVSPPVVVAEGPRRR